MLIGAPKRYSAGQLAVLAHVDWYMLAKRYSAGQLAKRYSADVYVDWYSAGAY